MIHQWLKTRGSRGRTGHIRHTRPPRARSLQSARLLIETEPRVRFRHRLSYVEVSLLCEGSANQADWVQRGPADQRLRFHVFHLPTAFESSRSSVLLKDTRHMTLLYTLTRKCQ
jgi:hypothetical protein